MYLKEGMSLASQVGQPISISWCIRWMWISEQD